MKRPAAEGPQDEAGALLSATPPPSGERWDKVKQLFEEAVARDPASRGAYLDAACGDDRELRGEVESLLAAHDRADSFFGQAPASPTEPGSGGASKGEARLAPGTRLGPYEILAFLNAGGMGEVYRARDTRLDRTVAVKVLPAAADAKRYRRFEREARAISRLSHPHICALYDVGQHDGVSFLVMEYLEGESLAERTSKGALPLEDALRHASEIAEALEEAHRQGIVHRDLKPANVVLSSRGAKLLDFGIAKLGAAAASEDAPPANTSELTGAGAIVGTLQYMAPEQLEGKPVDARADVFGFGVLLYEMVTGRKAFKADSAAGLVAAILQCQPVPVSRIRPDAPAWLDALIRRCLDKNQHRRFQSATEIRLALSDASAAFATRNTQVDAPAASKRKLPIPIPIVAGVAGLLAAAAVLSFRSRPADPATRPTPSIAVLPFTNLSGDKEQEYFSDGLSEELMGLLTKVKELRVAGRTSSFAFKGKTEDLASIGQKLHVATVLEGSVRRSGDRIRVSTRLVKVADGYQIWAETYDRKLTDVFAVQDDIARAVVAALSVELLPGERPVPSRSRTSIPEAYNQYLLGRRQNANNTMEWRRRAVATYQRAIKLDPEYAAAYAGLSVSEFWLAESAEVSAAAEGLKRAMAAAERAIALDGELADGYDARGLLRTYAAWDWAGALADLERALALDPGSSGIQVRYSYLLACLGRLPEAIKAARKAIELDPLSPRGGANLGRYLNALGQLPQARQALKQALEVDPDDEWAHFNLGTNALLEGQPGLALAEFRRAGSGARRRAGIAMAEHDLGHTKESQAALDELIASRTQDSAYRIAEVYAWRGEKDKAFEWLDRAHARGDTVLAYIKCDALVDTLRGDARYTAMLTRLKLPVGS